MTDLPSAPSWLRSYMLVKEIAANAAIARGEEEIARIRAELDTEAATLEAAEQWKELLFATGPQFADRVRIALGRLGMKVARGPYARADLIGWDGTRLYAIDAKGSEGAAREYNIRQCDRWAADIRAALAASEDERQKDSDLDGYWRSIQSLEIPVDSRTPASGLLVLGTFRETPLAERSEPDFPHPVEQVLNRTDVIALTGLQLLLMVQGGESDDQTGAAALAALRDSKGRVKQFDDWKTLLTQVSPSEPC